MPTTAYDPREAPLNDSWRRSCSWLGMTQYKEDSRIIRQLEHWRVDLSAPLKHYQQQLNETEATPQERRLKAHSEALDKALSIVPIDMILFCPQCGLQHIDDGNPACGVSHTCGYCNHIWRPADVPTNGVLEIRTRGQLDSTPVLRRVSPLDRFLPKWLHKKRGTTYREIGRGELQGFTVIQEGAPLVAYQGEDNRIWFRLETEFEDGRFERI